MQPEDSSDNYTYELVIPFVVVRSVGGQYDDDAYAAGWEMGSLDAALDAATLSPWDYQTVRRTIRIANVAQAHAVARAHKLTAHVVETTDPATDGWCVVEFQAAQDVTT